MTTTKKRKNNGSQIRNNTALASRKNAEINITKNTIQKISGGNYEQSCKTIQGI